MSAAEPTSRRPIGLAPGAPEQAAGQDAKKYSTTNPVVVRLIDRWLGRLTGVLAAEPLGAMVDVGVGEGLALERLVAADQRVIGVEYRLDKVRLAADRLPGLSGIVADAGMLPLADAVADTVTSIEVLEHLVDPAAAVEELARICRGRLVVSVPWEPWFRLGNLGRGKNVGRIGNDPEHVQQFSPGRLRRLLETQFSEVEVLPTFPWLIAVAAAPRVRSISA
ncbi:MAG TPA: class I SAM-dependent methyltransferase [Acidimicrobiales bacterium]|nr:class I SAM-dependent methyltransferase [Acidimicrobiales bacterium]